MINDDCIRAFSIFSGEGSTFAPVNLNVAAMYYFMISPRLQNVHFGSEIACPAPVINDEEESSTVIHRSCNTASK